MTAILRIEPSDPRPIWRQIEEGVRHLIVARVLTPGAPVPSVRDLARELQVNPATVAKAYQRLAEGGILVMQRGEGTFVADHPPSFSARQRTELLGEGAVRYAGLAASLQASRGEAVEALRAAWNGLEEERPR